MHTLITTLNVDFQAIDSEVKKEIDVAATKAKTEVEVSPSALYTHVYSNIPPGLKVRGADAFTYGSPK